MKQVNVLRDLARQGANQLPQDFDVSITDRVWHDLLKVPDRGKALAALCACAVTAIRRGLKGGRLWLAHSRKHRDREDMLVPSSEWQDKRQGLINALSRTSDPTKYLQRLRAKLEGSLAALAQTSPSACCTCPPALSCPICCSD